jgi:hypothetical protein
MDSEEGGGGGGIHGAASGSLYLDARFIFAAR